ncbi:CopG family transcriptional regulator [Picosynechococcus sp. PCC 11901]|nr:CopG family transcriptional regulator [Picosynechococcus sp. PCC 11901]
MTTKNLNVRISDREWQLLEQYCKKHQRSKTDVIREFIRSLSSH